MATCYSQDKSSARQLLVRKQKRYNNCIPFALAYKHELIDFMVQPACETNLSSLWKGKMTISTSHYMVSFIHVVVNLVYTWNFVEIWSFITTVLRMYLHILFGFKIVFQCLVVLETSPSPRNCFPMFCLYFFDY